VTIPPAFWFLISGAAGGLLKEIMHDNCIDLPKIGENGKVHLATLGGMTVSAVAGLFVDNTPLSAFLAGWAGADIVKSIVEKNTVELPGKK